MSLANSGACLYPFPAAEEEHPPERVGVITITARMAILFMLVKYTVAMSSCSGCCVIVVGVDPNIAYIVIIVGRSDTIAEQDR